VRGEKKTLLNNYSSHRNSVDHTKHQLTENNRINTTEDKINYLVVPKNVFGNKIKEESNVSKDFFQLYMKNSKKLADYASNHKKRRYCYLEIKN